MVLGIIGNKINSVFLGPAGYALIGQMSNYNTIIGTLANLGMGNGIVKYISEYYDNNEERKKIVETYIFATLTSSSILCVLSVSLSFYISEFLFQDSSYWFIIALSGVFLIFGAFGSLITNLLNGLKQFKRLITTGIIATALNLIVSIPLIMFFNVKGALLSVFIVFPITTYINFQYLKRTGFEYKILRPKLHKDSWIKLRKYTAMALTSMILLPLSQLILRNYIIAQLSVEAAGFWQAITKFSNLYLSVILASISLYYVPRLSEIKDKTELRKEILAAYAILLPITAIMSITFFFAKDLIIDLVYAPSFRPMRELFAFQLLGDFLRVMSYILAHLFIAKAIGKKFIFSEIIFTFSYLVLSVFFVNQYGVVGMTYAYALNFFLYNIFIYFTFRKTIIF